MIIPTKFKRSYCMRKKIFTFCLVFIIAVISSVTSHANQCTQAINSVSQKISVPKDVLTAVALTETGITKNGKLSPHPWAINVEGKGFLFSTKQKAINAVKKYLKQGKTSIDIGCMQLNWYWHGKKFDSSVEKAFDPMTNITVGARYIKQHYRKYRNWHKAAGRYHSGTKKFSQKYQQKYAVNLKIAKAQLGIKGTAIQVAKTTVTSTAPVSKKKSYPIYNFAMLSKAPGALFKFKDTGNIIKPKTQKASLYNRLPSAPSPILNTARKRRLFR